MAKSIDFNMERQKPMFTLAEWRQLFQGMETLEEFGNMEGLFRKDCMTGAFEIADWQDVSYVAFEKLKELQDKSK